MGLGGRNVFVGILVDKYRVEMEFFWHKPTPDKWAPYCPFNETSYMTTGLGELKYSEELKP